MLKLASGSCLEQQTRAALHRLARQTHESQDTAGSRSTHHKSLGMRGGACDLRTAESPRCTHRVARRLRLTLLHVTRAAASRRCTHHKSPQVTCVQSRTRSHWCWRRNCRCPSRLPSGRAPLAPRKRRRGLPRRPARAPGKRKAGRKSLPKGTDPTSLKHLYSWHAAAAGHVRNEQPMCCHVLGLMARACARTRAHEDGESVTQESRIAHYHHYTDSSCTS